MGRGKSKTVGEVIIEPAGEWTVTLDGLHLDADLIPTPPGVQIVTTRRFARSDDKDTTIGFQFAVIDIGTAEPISSKDFEAKTFERREVGFERARDMACSYVLTSARKHLRGGDTDLAATYVRLKDLILSEAKLETERIKGKKQVRFRMVEAADLALCLDVLQENFDNVFSGASVIFRFRQEWEDGCMVDWTKGRAADGGDVTILGLAQRISGEKGELFRDLLKFAPDFVITFNEPRWAKMDVLHRRALVYHELCHCCLDAETGKPFVASHDIEEFSAVVEKFGPRGVPSASNRNFLFEAYRSGAELDQLDFFQPEASAGAAPRIDSGEVMDRMADAIAKAGGQVSKRGNVTTIHVNTDEDPDVLERALDHIDDDAQ